METLIELIKYIAKQTEEKAEQLTIPMKLGVDIAFELVKLRNIIEIADEIKK